MEPGVRADTASVCVRGHPLPLSVMTVRPDDFQPHAAPRLVESGMACRHTSGWGAPSWRRAEGAGGQPGGFEGGQVLARGAAHLHCLLVISGTVVTPHAVLFDLVRVFFFFINHCFNLNLKSVPKFRIDKFWL